MALYAHKTLIAGVKGCRQRIEDSYSGKGRRQNRVVLKVTRGVGRIEGTRKGCRQIRGPYSCNESRQSRGYLEW